MALAGLLGWLEHNQISIEQLRAFIYSEAPLAYKPNCAERDCLLSAQEALALCADSLSSVLPAYTDTIKLVKNRSHTLFSEIDDPEAQPYTVDNGQGSLPTISVPYRGRVEDLVNMAHEFAHAVQITLSDLHNPDRRHMPPVWRECCAFLGELVLIEYLRKNPLIQLDLAKHVKEVWDCHNTVYLGNDLEILAGATLRKEECGYQCNYPIARFLSNSIWDRRETLGDAISELFCAGSDVKKYSRFLESERKLETPPKVFQDKEDVGEIDRYMYLGIAVLMDCFSEKLQKATIEGYFKKLNAYASKDGGIFVCFNSDVRPVSYALVKDWDLCSKKITLEHLCSPYGLQKELIKVMKNQAGDGFTVCIEK